MNFEKIMLYLAVVVLIGGLVWTASGLLSHSEGSSRYEKFVSAENPEDICEKPDGYSDELWKEHLGHHPDRYEDCL